MKKNDLVTLKIEDIGKDGEGIGKADGLTLFVKDAVVGDIISAKIMKLKKNYGYARLMEIISPSKDRVEAPCRYAKSCGGCQIMELSYEKQLEFKYNKVKNNLKRIGGFSDEKLESVMEPIVGMEDPYRYRNKAQFPIGTDSEGNIITGFYAGRTHKIIPNEDCLLGAEVNKTILNEVISFMREEKITAYNEEEHTGTVRHVLTRVGNDSGQIMVCLIINADNLKSKEKLIDRLSKISGMQSISININKDKTNVILGKTTKILWGEEYITDSIYLRDTDTFERLKGAGESKTIFRISAQSFFQVNPVQTEKLYSLALDYAGLTGSETVWDLYCGIGSISLFLAKSAGKVYGVEIVPQAIENAKENALLNGYDNAEFFVGAAEDIVPGWLESPKGKPDVVVVDPPRKGLDPVCIETILGANPKRVVYVSCDSATLARDLKMFVEGGYELERVRPVDQFAHTGHVETIALIERVRNAKDFVQIGIDVEEYYRIKDEEN
ncbi:MAG: 23S rRNA (uracil(1939)-C(5))-methyltransferase RlmD [Lachnospiraceae bacterium]|nr:23S rRNA (uracil(1939)-C(5))-methyltransferase RlmD [Lachnospiraceae bacterium]